MPEMRLLRRDRPENHNEVIIIPWLCQVIYSDNRSSCYSGYYKIQPESSSLHILLSSSLSVERSSYKDEGTTVCLLTISR